MARVLCSLSGIDFKVQHMLIYNTQQQSHHPIFDLSTPHLLELHSQYLENKLEPIENYLYYVALFRSTGLLNFRVATKQQKNTQSIIANTMHSLIRMVTRIHTIGLNTLESKRLDLPIFVITPDTCDLENTKHWLAIWENNYKDYCNGYRATTLIADINRKELQLEKKIKDHTDPSQYGAILAEWAALAGAFPHSPDSMVLDEADNVCFADEYWKRIIRIAAKGDSIFHIPMEDINDVIDQCEENIDHGSIQAHSLMSVLRAAKERKHNYLSLGDIDIRGTFKILDADSSIEDANMQALILSAPRFKPVETQYPNKLAFRLANIKYNQAVQYYKDNQTEWAALGEDNDYL